MKKYFIPLLLNTFLLNPFDLKASYKSEEELAMPHVPKVVLDDGERAEVFQSYILAEEAYSKLDPDMSIRRKIFAYDTSDINISGEESGETIEQLRKNFDLAFRMFLKFGCYSTDGTYDLGNPYFRNIYLTQAFYTLDQVFHGVAHAYADEGDELIVRAVLPCIERPITTLPMHVQILLLDSMHKRFNHFMSLNPQEKSFLNLGSELIMKFWANWALTFLESPSVTFEELIEFSINMDTRFLYRVHLVSGKRTKPGNLFDLLGKIYSQFIQSSSSNEEQKQIMRDRLASIALDFCLLVPQVEVFDTYTDKKKLHEIFEKVGFDFFSHCMWPEHDTTIEISPIDALFYLAMAPKNYKDYPAVLNMLSRLDMFLDGLFMNLNSLHTIHPLKGRILRYIQTKSLVIHLNAGKVPKRGLVTAFQANELRLYQIIENFYKRLEAEKQAAAKAKTQSAANDAFSKRLTDDFQKLDAGLSAFLDRHPQLKSDDFIPTYLSVQNLGAITPQSRPLTYLNTNWYAELVHALIQLNSLKTQSPVTIQDIRVLGDRMKFLDKLYKEADSFFEKESKFEKKRKKDEAKALKAELRAKQKAEERAKRASTQLAPSPDPSPYPSVHADLEEKRLSRAEIAEKHMSQSRKAEEKRNSKSLRQSFRDLFHIGQADEQTDKRDSKRFSRSSKRQSEIATTAAPLDLSQHGAIDRQSLKADIKDLWEGRKQLANANDQKAFVEILDALNLATDLGEIRQSFSHGDNFEQLNSGKIKGFNYKKKDTVYSIRLHGKSAYRICFTWDGINKKVCNVQFGDYH